MGCSRNVFALSRSCSDLGVRMRLLEPGVLYLEHAFARDLRGESWFIPPPDQARDIICWDLGSWEGHMKRAIATTKMMERLVYRP